MPIYEVEHNGQVYEVDAPTPEAAAGAFSQPALEPSQSLTPDTGEKGFWEQAQDGLVSIGKGAAGVAETALIGAGSGLTEVAAGLRGIGAGLVPGGMSGAEAVQATRDAAAPLLTPRTEVGQGIASAIAPVMQRVEQFADTAGEVTGDPGDTLGATGVQTAIMAVPTLLGARRLAQSGIAQPKVRETLPEAPTTAEVRQIADDAYTAVTESGVTLKPESTASLAQTIAEAVDDVDPDLHPQSFATLQKLQERLSTGEPITFDELMNARRLANNTSQAVKISNPDDARIANNMRREIDSYVDSLQKDSVASGDPLQALQNISTARQAWKQFKKAALIEELIESAKKRSEANYSGANFDTALRQEFKSLALNKNMRNKWNMFSEAEKAAVEAVIKGSVATNIQRQLGKFSATSGIGGPIAGAAGLSAVGPVGIVLFPLLGSLARRGANRGTSSAAEAASEIIRRNAPSSPPTE